jgi:hypothetical protein
MPRYRLTFRRSNTLNGLGHVQHPRREMELYEWTLYGTAYVDAATIDEAIRQFRQEFPHYREIRASER